MGYRLDADRGDRYGHKEIIIQMWYNENNVKKYILATILTLASAVSGVFAGYAFLPNEVTYQPVQVVHNEAPSLGAVQNTKFVGTLPTTLSGAGINTSATSIGVSSLTLKQSGYLLTIADFGTTAYLTLEPGNSSRQEFASCTGITQNSNGTAVFTTCTRGLAPIYPYTASSTFAFVHGGGTTVIVSNSPPFYNNFTIQNNDASITGYYTFGSTTLPRVATDTTDAQLVAQGTTTLATINYVNGVAVSGAPNATEAVKGIVELSTTAEAAAGTSAGATGARLVVPNSMCNATWSAATLCVITNAAGKIAQGFLDLTQSFTFSGGLTSTATTTISGTTTFNGITFGANVYVQYKASTTISVGQPVFVASSTNAVGISDANDGLSQDFLGFAVQSGTNGATTTIQIDGIVNGLSGLTSGQYYYVQDAVGTIGTTVGTAELYVGRAVSATQLLIDKIGPQFLGSGSFSAATGNSTTCTATVAVPTAARSFTVVSIMDNVTSHFVSTYPLTRSGSVAPSGYGRCSATDCNVSASITGNVITSSGSGANDGAHNWACSGTAYFYR